MSDASPCSLHKTVTVTYSFLYIPYIYIYFSFTLYTKSLLQKPAWILESFIKLGAWPIFGKNTAFPSEFLYFYPLGPFWQCLQPTSQVSSHKIIIVPARIALSRTCQFLFICPFTPLPLPVPWGSKETGMVPFFTLQCKFYLPFKLRLFFTTTPWDRRQDGEVRPTNMALRKQDGKALSSVSWGSPEKCNGR